MKRCFVALRLPEETRAALGRLLVELRELAPAAARRLRPVRSTNLHLTLKFLGATPDDQVPTLTAALEPIARRSRLPPLTLDGIGAFPSADRPRILFAAPLHPQEPLCHLAEEIEQACLPLGFAAEKRGQHPHVTLARIEAATPRGPLSDFIARHAHDAFGALDVSALVLFESQLSPSGSIYTPLATLALGAA
ncbi:MAG: RNA 2',3'-cyclic phosphodiesterase [Deltaproteobacteria bacterium]|nr:RNA 2',3'-cyclic phosphodiesterase [Deltaproteobacteria bacterium]